MLPHLRILLLAIGLFLVFTASFVPIFWSEATTSSGLASSHRSDSTRNKLKGYPKYFQEGQGGGILHHYDSRFQHGILTDTNRMDAQTHMMRAYLEFSKEQGLETWLAHGTLLGWWWNAKVSTLYVLPSILRLQPKYRTDMCTLSLDPPMGYRYRRTTHTCLPRLPRHAPQPDCLRLLLFTHSQDQPAVPTPNRDRRALLFP